MAARHNAATWVAAFAGSTVSGVAMAENSTPVPPTETGAIVTASLENGIINGEAGSAGVASAGILPSVNSVAEGGPAILLLVALALMAAVLLGRRNNGGA